jgi:hypothetical protein
VSELWEVSRMIQSCMSVEDCELLEDIRVNGSVLELCRFVGEGSECWEMWE